MITDTKTHNRFKSKTIEVGDVFTERLSYFMHVVRIIDGRIVTLEGSDRGGNKSIIKEYGNIEEFEKHCSYDHTDGYWIDYMGNYGEAVMNIIKKYQKAMRWPASLTDRQVAKQRTRRREIEQILYNI